MSSKERIDRYLAYNRSRILKAVKFKEEKASILFKVIPFLLHVNYPDLPGYVLDATCPYGIIKFNPLQALPKETFYRFFPDSSAMAPTAASLDPPRPSIHSVMTIGSIGTIAQTAKSDCDYWLSVRKADMPENGLALLAEKCKAIEEWAMTLGHEIHFFLMDLDQTRDNSFDSRADDESAGSALKLLLKDELFRTHILVAGKMPVWWLIPPGLTESEYRDFVKALPTKEKINMESFIDLGYISNLPKSEVFGACLWQMNKALDSPFKSVLKFAYLELLMNDQQTLNLFSDRIKQLVTFPEELSPENQLEIDDIDPYLLLARELVAFYQQEETDKKRDEFIRACLFMKTLEDINARQNLKNADAHLKHTTTLMMRWNLLPADAAHYLRYRYWSHQDRLTAGAMVHSYLSDTYKRLSWYLRSFRKEDRGLTITEEDIAILGRKLSSFYANKPDKIDYIQSLSREMMSQPDITLHLTKIGGKDVFFAFQGQDASVIKNPKDFLIKREENLIRLLTWMMANGILTKETHLHLTKNSLTIDLQDIQGLVSTMLDAFPLIKFSHISASQLLAPEFIVRALAIINFEKSPVRGAKTIKSSIISTNSYGEYFLHDYGTLAQYKSALRLLLTKYEVSRWHNNLTVFIPPQPEQHALQTLLNS
jgi:adenylate cyclase class 1